MFDTVLVANRGEIAVRVIRTLRALGIRSVAVYSDADADARHVREADVAVRIGPAAAARELPVDRAHHRRRRADRRAGRPPGLRLPGGERRVRARPAPRRGLVFVGPPAAAIEAMGDKIRAKPTVSKAGVPVVPGASDVDMPDDGLRRRGRRRSASRCCSSRPPAAAARACGWCTRRTSCGAAIAVGPARGPELLRRRHAAGRALRARRRGTSRSRSWPTTHGNVAPPRRARVQPAAPAPEDHRGGAVASLLDEATRAAMGAAGGRGRRARSATSAPAPSSSSCRRDRPGRVLLHGDEHPAAGRAPGHRAGHRPRPRRAAAAGRGGGAAFPRAGRHRPHRPRHRGARLRRGPGARLPARPAARCWRCTSRPATASASTRG